MITSPATATNKWCPMTRVANGTQATNTTINRSWNQDGHAPDVFCLGDSCMMWRWSDIFERAGYCGLAGKPVEVEK